MLVGHDSTMVGHQGLGVPASLKHRRVHRPARRGVIARPHLDIIKPLQGLVRTEQSTSHIAADMLKACVPTEDVAVWGQPPADRLGHSDDWQHAWHPGLGFSSPAVGIFVYLP
jgi:hypothetical protein